jgi:hypothetical protein
MESVKCGKNATDARREPLTSGGVLAVRRSEEKLLATTQAGIFDILLKLAAQVAIA